MRLADLTPGVEYAVGTSRRRIARRARYLGHHDGTLSFALLANATGAPIHPVVGGKAQGDEPLLRCYRPEHVWSTWTEAAS